MSTATEASPITRFSGEALEPNRRVHFNGTATFYADGDAVGIGVTDNRSDASGLAMAVRLFSGGEIIPITASGSISAGANVYAAVDGKVAATGTELVGRNMSTSAIADGSTCPVLPVGVTQGDSDQFYSQTAAGSALTASSTETTIADAGSLPANSLKVGDVIEVTAQVIATATNSTDTLTLKAKIGGVQMVTTGAVDVADGDIGYIKFEAVVRTIGATGTMVAAGVQGLGVPGTVTAKPFLKASGAIDTTAAVPIILTGQWSTTSGSNSCRCDVFNVQVRRKAA